MNEQCHIFLLVLCSITYFITVINLYHPKIKRELPDYSMLEKLEPLHTQPRTTLYVFYNVYIPEGEFGKDHATNIVREQVALAKSHHHISVNTIGQQLNISQLCPSCAHQAHYKSGGENITLNDLWEFCRKHPTERVGYLHSKGTFHATLANYYTRRFLTQGVFADECSSIPNTCTVCSSSFSPLPHMHTPGNMWTSHCSYISKLLHPDHFRSQMDMMYYRYNIKIPTHSFGAGRFSYEHWVHSHPDNQPCDLHNPKGPQHSYLNLVKTSKWQPQLARTPRQPIQWYRGKWVSSNMISNGYGWNYDLNSRVVEWDTLYGTIARKSGWLWNYYNTTYLDVIKEVVQLPWVTNSMKTELERKYNVTLKTTSRDARKSLTAGSLGFFMSFR